MFRINSTLLFVLVVGLLAISSNITSSWTSPMYIRLYSNKTTENPLGKPITKEVDSWLGSLLNVAALIGALSARYLANKIGSKNLLIATSVPHILAFLTYAFARNVYLLYTARLIQGISVGISYAILPVYVKEISEYSNRALVTLDIFWILGSFIPYTVGPYLGVRAFNLTLSTIPCVFLISFLFIGSETPQYLVQMGQYSEAEKIIMKLRSCDKDTAKNEVQTLKVTFNNHYNSGLKDLLKNRDLYVSLGLIILQQLSGITAISYYIESILAASGAELSSSISSVIFGGSMFIISFIILFYIEPVGKKFSLAISCFGCALCLLVLGGFFYIKDNTLNDTNLISKVPLFGLIAFVFFFKLGLGPLPWIISSEILPNTASSSIVAGCFWLSAFIISKFFNLLNDFISKSGTFWIYSGFCLLTIIFDYIWVPETKRNNIATL